MGRASVCGPKPSRTSAAGGPAVSETAVGGLNDSLRQQRGRVGGRGWAVVLAVGVQADDGVEVDDATCLVFSDLDEADADSRAEGL